MFQVKVPLAGRSAEDMLALARNKAKERKGCLIQGTSAGGKVIDGGKHMADFSFDANHMVIHVLHKPLLVPQGLVERELKSLFS